MISLTDSMYPVNDVMKMALYLSGIPPLPFPKTPSASVIMTKMSLKRHSTKHLTITLQKCQGHQNVESQRNCHSWEEPKETWWRNVMWYAG